MRVSYKIKFKIYLRLKEINIPLILFFKYWPTRMKHLKLLLYEKSEFETVRELFTEFPIKRVGWGCKYSRTPQILTPLVRISV